MDAVLIGRGAWVFLLELRQILAVRAPKYDIQQRLDIVLESDLFLFESTNRREGHITFSACVALKQVLQLHFLHLAEFGERKVILLLLWNLALNLLTNAYWVWINATVHIALFVYEL